MGLKNIKKKLQEQYWRGKEKTEQQKAERLRKKTQKRINMKPGAKKAILDGLDERTNPMEVMRREYTRRKYEREQKKKEMENTRSKK